MRPLIVDALASGRGKRQATRDVIGAGPRTVAGVLERGGLRPRIVQAQGFFEGAVDTEGYDLLLASGMTSDFRAIRGVIKRWKEESSGPVLVGGPVASEPEKVLLKAQADICVIGEGEQTLRELLDAGLNRERILERGDLEGIRGLAYQDSGVVNVNALRPTMKREIFESLDPSIATIKDYPLHRSARVYVEVVRGCSNYHRARAALAVERCSECGKCERGDLEERYYCPGGIPPGCGYCSVPSLFGPPKSRSVDRIFEEVRGLLSMGVRRIVLSGPGFLDYGRDLLVEPLPLTDPRRPEPNYPVLEELLSLLKGLELVAEGEASIMIENIKASLVTPRAAEILGRYLEGTPVNVGFETGSQEHSRQLGRASTPEENMRALERLRGAGLKPYAYFIHGLPGQNAKTVDETVKTIDGSVKAGASRIILYRFQPLPMSAFRDWPKAPPAVKDSLSRRIYDAARSANRALKEDLRGEKLRVVVAGPYERDRRYHVAYPMLHGPVVLVEGAEDLTGEVIDVEVVGVVSDRMVRGRLPDAMF